MAVEDISMEVMQIEEEDNINPVKFRASGKILRLGKKLIIFFK